MTLGNPLLIWGAIIALGGAGVTAYVKLSDQATTLAVSVAESATESKMQAGSLRERIDELQKAPENAPIVRPAPQAKK